MNNNIKISIITVCKNAEKEIEQTIRSVLEQTYPNIEHIIIDGASTDGTMAIIEKYKEKIAKVISEPDGGIYEAMNKGIKLAKGDFMCFLNAGDWLCNKNVIEKIVFYLCEDGYSNDIYVGDIVRDDGEKISTIASLPNLEKLMSLGNTLPHPSSIIKKELFKICGLYDESFRIAGDYEWFVRVVVNYKKKVKYISMNVAFYNFYGISSIQSFKKLTTSEGYRVRVKYFGIKAVIRILFEKIRELVLGIFENRCLTMRGKFEKYYFQNVFNSTESRSGEGSTITQTHVIRKELPLLFKELGIKVLVDAPCGDLNWIKEIELKGIEYIGIDIVKAIIDKNNDNTAFAGKKFFCLDITCDDLPLADIILCRDCLVHLTFRQAQKAIKNIKRSGSKYLLTTTFVNRKKNEELKEVWRTINLEIPPFNFPPPIKLINERCAEAGGEYSDKCLGLWRIEDINK